jgi:transposase
MSCGEVVNAILYVNRTGNPWECLGGRWLPGRHLHHGAGLGIDVEVVQRPRTRRFEPLPKRWVIWRIFGWLMQHRRLTRDYEVLPQRSRT